MKMMITGVFFSVGIAMGSIIPSLAWRIIRYKCIKRHKEIPPVCKLRWQIAMAILNVILFTLAGWKLPTAEAVMVCVFVLIAIISTLVDIEIRIISNEMVLLLLVSGVIYRIISGGAESLLGSLGALAIVIAIFGGSALISKRLMKDIGIGAGDLKLAMAIAITVGYPEVYTFLFGLAIAVGLYCVAGLKLCLLTRKSTFPMCGHIMAGFLFVLFMPYIQLLFSGHWG